MITTLLFVVLFVLLLIGVPVAVSLGLATALVAEVENLFDMNTMVQQIFNSMNSFPLMAIPFFILAGYLMQTGGISERLVDFATSLVGHLTGGLAMVAIVTSMFFAAISGSGAATVAAVGSILIPAMIAKGYDLNYATANQAAAGALGVIIPPSIPMILYAISAQTSVSDMFLAGMVPGFLITISLMIYAYYISNKRGYVGVERSTFKELMISLKRATLSLLMPIIILGGIYSGIFTPTESAVVAVVYALFIGVVVYRKLTFMSIVDVMQRSAVTTSITMLIIGVAGLFSYLLTRLNIPNQLSELFLNVTTSVIIFIIVVNIVLLITGMFIESGAAILILVPILLPIAIDLGIDPVHFGVIMVVNLAMGMFTPPVGINLFVALDITDGNYLKVVRAIIPFVVILIVDLLLISYLPFLSTWFM